MKGKMVESFGKKVLNTHRKGKLPEENVDVSVLLSDYVKLKVLARERRQCPIEVLKEILCRSVRRLAGASSVALVVALSVLMSLHAEAGIFGPDTSGTDGKPAVRERQIGLFGAAKAADYKAECEARTNVVEDCIALARMIQEKEDRYAEISADLERKYGMTLSQNYNYSKEDLTLYLVVTNGLFGSSPENPVMRAHRAFLNEEDAQGFVGMVASRTAVAEDVADLRRFLAEKRRDLEQKESRLRDEYGVFQGKNYRLDEKTGILFELQPLPTDAELRAQREAEARAVADAREHARLKAEADRKAAQEAEAARKKAKAEAEAKARAEREAEKKRIEAERESQRKAAKEAEAAKERARKEAEAKARAEKERLAAEKRAAEARAKAEREAREKEELERREAEKKAKREAEARERAEREAREKAEQARREAEKKAKREAEARERAEREAREKAEQARREAEKKAKREAEARERAEAEAREKAEKVRREAEARARDDTNW